MTAPESVLPERRTRTPGNPVTAQTAPVPAQERESDGIAGGPLAIMAVIDWRTARNALAALGDEIRSRLLVIDNAAHGRPRTALDVWGYHRPEWNLGISRSFNHAIGNAYGAGATGVIWISAGLVFIDRGRSLLDLEAAGPEVVVSEHGWHAVAIGLPAFERVGTFDENYYPAYVEDTDWRRRWQLAGGQTRSVELGTAVAQDGHGYNALRREHSGRPVINFDALDRYYIEKWGGIYARRPGETGQETFDRPFGRTDVDLDWWPEPPPIPQLARRYQIAVRRRRRR